MSRRRGHSLPELLVALVLGAIVCAALAGVLEGEERVVRRHGRRVQLTEALRVVGVALGDDLRLVDPDADLRAVADDSLALRVFRGAAIVCAHLDGAAAVRYRGLRSPDPAKDSVLVLDGIGRAAPLDLTAVAAANGTCEARAGETLLRWTLDPVPTRGTLILLYESGSYHIAVRALRYRRGDGGRQPLTAEIFDARRSGFDTVDDSGAPSTMEAAAAVVGIFAPAPDPAAVDAASGPARAVRLHFPLLNHRVPGSGVVP